MLTVSLTCLENRLFNSSPFSMVDGFIFQVQWWTMYINALIFISHPHSALCFFSFFAQISFYFLPFDTVCNMCQMFSLLSFFVQNENYFQSLQTDEILEENFFAYDFDFSWSKLLWILHWRRKFAWNGAVIVRFEWMHQCSGCFKLLKARIGTGIEVFESTERFRGSKIYKALRKGKRHWENSINCSKSHESHGFLHFKDTLESLDKKIR